MDLRNRSLPEQPEDTEEMEDMEEVEGEEAVLIQEDTAKSGVKGDERNIAVLLFLYILQVQDSYCRVHFNVDY